MTDISDRLKAARERVMARIRERRATKRKTKTMPTPPRYDGNRVTTHASRVRLWSF
jgi:hypothetical protein